MLLFLYACTEPKPTDDTAADTDTDTDADSDTDTDSDSDTDTDTDTDTDSDTDTDTDTNETTALMFELSGDFGGTVLTLTAYDVTRSSLGEVLATVEARGATVTVTTGPAPKGDLVDSGYPGMSFAMYVPALFTDSDGDLRPGGADAYVGVGQMYAVYIEGDVPAELGVLGLRSGWNAAILDLGDANGDGALFDVGDIRGIPVDTNLTAVDSAEVSGTYDGEPAGLALVAYTTLIGEAPVDVLYDASASATWATPVSSPPPTEHFATVGSTSYAFEVPTLYADEDDIAGASIGDGLLGYACLGDAAGGLGYAAPPTDLSVAMDLVDVGLNAGWTPIVADPSTSVGFRPMTPAEASSLTLATGCSIGEAR